MNKKILFLILLMILLLPLVAVGSAVDTSVNISDGFGRANSYSLTTVLTSILNALWIVFSAIAVILFVIAGIFVWSVKKWI